MALVVVGSLLTAAALGYQALYIFYTGRLGWFFVLACDRGARLTGRSRIVHGVLYLLPSVAIVTLLTAALVRGGFDRLREWTLMNLDLVVFATIFLISGVLLVVKPDKMLRWMIQSNPQIATNRAMLVIAQIIGVFFIAGALRMFASP
jgi:hypothetical protein